MWSVPRRGASAVLATFVTVALTLECFSSPLDFHTVNVALLQICGGIAGSIEKCEGAPTSTTGVSGNVQFSITPVQKGATINISKGRWERESYPSSICLYCG